MPTYQRGEVSSHPLNKIKPGTTQWLTTTFQIPTTSHPPKYLGIQFKNGRNNSHMFAELLQRIERKARGCICKCVNQAGSLLLINSSLTPTANHVMQTQLLPAHILIHKNMDKIVHNFFWGDDKHIKKFHHVAWNNLVKPKEEGGASGESTIKV